MLIPICNTDVFTDPSSKGFELTDKEIKLSVFIVHKDGEFHSYINSCPHTGVNLEWQENQFLDMENSYIQCSTHDALFEISTGMCVSGPCIGERLTRVKHTIDENGLIKIDISQVDN